MATSNNSVGAIILGTSGAGKRFLGNVILGREAFKHQYRSNTVTAKTEYQESSFNGQTYAIYNIPDLIENDQERIELNKREIDISFRQHPNAVVFYVFSTNHGRIKNEDVVAFNAINTAYPLSKKSLIAAVNGVDPNRSSDYDAETTTVLSSLLKMHVPHICFVNQISQPSDREPVRRQLIQTITSAMRKSHNKVPEVNSQSDEILKLKKQIEQDRQEYRLEIGNLKRALDDLEKQQKKLQDEIQKPKGAQGQTVMYQKKPCDNCLSCHYLGASPCANAGYYHLFYGSGYGNTYGVHPYSPLVACNCNCHK
ncbi:unnamed protein product [Adineta steineri]|uniref:AIG1-type G domain-containing protein n=1 Tax=Adineta steineri TaxID=433720 RepID=A0A815L9C0_9BILA|nr:unnamed protein product [Adineta steineri]CAF4049088.1 unnamed protein product [Adineta steineri]